MLLFNHRIAESFRLEGHLRGLQPKLLHRAVAALNLDKIAQGFVQWALENLTGPLNLYSSAYYLS